MPYVVKHGDSPTSIARRFGVPMSALIKANPHKSTTIVGGKRTWRDINIGESVRVPAGGTVGDGFLGVTPASPVGSHPLLKRYAGNDSSQVALLQKLLNITADGVFGAGTESAVKTFQAKNGLYADGIVGPNTWAKLLGAPAPAASASAPASAPVTAASSSSPSLAIAASAAVAALVADPGYCTSVKKSGTPVNTAIHNFKAAWNAANPRSPVPINTGNYEPSVASALSSALMGTPVPPGCGAAAAPPAPTPAAMPVSVPAVTPAAIPAAAQALASVDPCYSGNVSMVCAMQRALGLTVDGKYGPATAAALRKIVPNAPAACPTQSWWGKAGESKCGGAVTPSLPPPVFSPVPSPGVSPIPIPGVVPPASSMPTIITSPGLPTGTTPMTQVVTTATPTEAAAQPGPIQPAVLAPEQKKLSTAALVAGGVGLAALVGVVAVAASGKKHRSGGRSGGHRKAHRKSSHKRSSKKRRR